MQRFLGKGTDVKLHTGLSPLILQSTNNSRLEMNAFQASFQIKLQISF